MVAFATRPHADWTVPKDVWGGGLRVAHGRRCGAPCSASVGALVGVHASGRAGLPLCMEALRAGYPESLHRIAIVPFTLRNLKEDLEDVGSKFDGAPDLEFRLATQALGLEQSGLSYQRVPPGYRFPYGHTHKKQEEVYVVVRGSGRMKLDDEIVELEEWDVVRVPPGTWRGYEAGPEGPGDHRRWRAQSRSGSARRRRGQARLVG